MKNKYDIGYLAWDKHDNVYGIIIKVVDNGPRHHAHSRWGYYIRWSDQKTEVGWDSLDIRLFRPILFVVMESHN